MKKICCTYFFPLLLIFIYSNAKGQTITPENNIDSLPAEKSSLQIGISFASQALSSGRNFGVNQYSILPSISYNHKSGVYTSIAGNVLSDASPLYNCTVISLGYGDSINNKWDYGFYYSRNIFNPDSAGLIKNTISGSIIFLPRYFIASLQYAYLFGNEKAHRLTMAANAYMFKEFSKKIINTISFTPGVVFTFGTSNVPFNNFTSTQFQKGTGTTWQQWKLQRIRPATGTINTSNFKKNSFGLMNIDITVPLTISIKNLSIGLNYTYAIPKKLPEENSAGVNATGYFGVSFSCIIK